MTRRTDQRNGAVVDVTVDLTARPPAEAIGLVLYDDDGALSWANEGEPVTLAWVDQFGRLSDRSAAITVTAGTP